MTLRFSQVDVFTDTLTLGNPVAVVHGADALSDDQMAAFARWTNLSETTFLLTPSDERADYRVRIFTVGGELPFAGHPTLGSARAWLDAGGVPADATTIVQECGAGLVRVRRDGDRLAFAAPPRVRSDLIEPEVVDEIVAGLGLDPSRVLGARWCDNGPQWMGLLLDGADAVLGVDLSSATFGGHDKVGLIGAHRNGVPTDFEVRAFFRGFEDPVTGSLNAAFAQWLIADGLAPSEYTVAQGTALRRRGRVHVQTDGADVWIGGQVVPGIEGTVELGEGERA